MLPGVSRQIPSYVRNAYARDILEYSSESEQWRPELLPLVLGPKSAQAALAGIPSKEKDNIVEERHREIHVRHSSRRELDAKREKPP